MRNRCPRKASLQAVVAKMRKRVRDEQGETITETLVSVLIGGLALLMLAVVLATANHIVMDSRHAMDDYYTATNGMATASGNASGKVTVTLTESNAAGTGSTTLASTSVNVNYVIDEITGKTVVSYSATD